MITLKEKLQPVYDDIKKLGINRDITPTLEQLFVIMNKGLLVPKYSYEDRVWFLHNNKIKFEYVEGYEITQTRDIQTIMYCFQDQDFNKIEEDLFETREALIDSLK